MILDSILEKVGVSLLTDIFLAIAFLLVGIFLGKIIANLLLKISKSIDVEKRVKPSFVKLIIVVIKWSIYIGFFNLALGQLPFPLLTELVRKILVVVPAFTAALILISIGFVIAVYLRDVVEDSEVTEWRMLSQYLYYFILYVFGVYAINLALVSVDVMVRNWITIALTTIVIAALTYVVVKKEVKKIN